MTEACDRLRGDKEAAMVPVDLFPWIPLIICLAWVLAADD
jgi:hypothetical protein